MVYVGSGIDVIVKENKRRLVIACYTGPDMDRPTTPYVSLYNTVVTIPLTDPPPNPLPAIGSIQLDARFIREQNFAPLSLSKPVMSATPAKTFLAMPSC